MNQQFNSRDQHGDLNWATEGWDNSNTTGGLEIRPYQGANRVDHWDWENPMILAHTAPGAVAGESSGHGYEDQKPQVLSGLMAPSMRPCSGLLSSNFASSFSHNIGLMEPTAIQPFGGVDLSGATMTNPLSLHGNYGFSNYAGLTAENISQSSDFRYFDQQRSRLLGSLGTHDHKLLTDLTKPNEMYSAESHARIGLNLGFRTYFSAEDTIFGRLGKRPRANSPSSLQVPMCQAEGCKADLTNAKHYHRRHKVCELHSKAAIVIANGQNQRFCQQCSRFQPLSEFDEGKRSCRKRLADHNRRRRKPQPACTASTSNIEAVAEPLQLKGEEAGEQAGTSHSQERNRVAENLNKGSSPSGSLENPGSKRTLYASYSPQSESPSALFSSHSPSLLPSSDHPNPVSLSPSMALLIRDKGSKSPELPGQAHDAVPQHYLQAVGAHGLRGTGLTLSSAEPMREGLPSQIQSEPSCQTYNLASNTFPWLKFTPVKSEFSLSANKLVHDKTGIDSRAASTSSAEYESGIPAFSPSIQNLLPFQSSRPMEQSDWILKNITGSKSKSQTSSQFAPSNQNSQGNFESNQKLHFLDYPSLRADNEVQQSRIPVEFLQQKSRIGSLESDEGSELPELQVAMRPFGSTYDPNINFP